MAQAMKAEAEALPSGEDEKLPPGEAAVREAERTFQAMKSTAEAKAVPVAQPVPVAPGPANSPGHEAALPSHDLEDLHPPSQEPAARVIHGGGVDDSTDDAAEQEKFHLANVRAGAIRPQSHGEGAGDALPLDVATVNHAGKTVGGSIRLQKGGSQAATYAEDANPLRRADGVQSAWAGGLVEKK